MSAHRLQHWPNINPTFFLCMMFLGTCNQVVVDLKQRVTGTSRRQKRSFSRDYQWWSHQHGGRRVNMNTPPTAPP